VSKLGSHAIGEFELRNEPVGRLIHSSSIVGRRTANGTLEPQKCVPSDPNLQKA
jgi:hypothetical protein